MDNYVCRGCGWEGPESELEYEEVDGCCGSDRVEVCPKCGNQNVMLVRTPTEGGATN